jgi:hypothetical protein
VECVGRTKRPAPLVVMTRGRVPVALWIERSTRRNGVEARPPHTSSCLRRQASHFGRHICNVACKRSKSFRLPAAAELLSCAIAGAHPVRDALAAFKAKSGRSPAATESLSLCVAKEKVTKEIRPPRLALVGHPAQQVREPGPGFSNGHPARAKRSRHPCRLPLRGLSTPPHRRTGAPGRAAGHPGPHSVRNRCAVARAKGSRR